MKKIAFTKMEGAGNDFIIVDYKPGMNFKRLAVKMCHRTTGIGADGLLLLQKSKKSDYRMRIFNADGSEAEMCGNGARCLAAYIAKTKPLKKKQFTIETKAGKIHAINPDKTVTITLSSPKNYTSAIPLTICGQKIRVSFMNTGVPHVVVFVEGLQNIDVNGIAPFIRWHKKFTPRGANVNFVEQINKNLVGVRTFERGVEAETRACGTGAVASGLTTYLRTHPKLNDKENATMDVLTASEEVLRLTFDVQKNKICHVRLTGSAHFIARGEYYV